MQTITHSTTLGQLADVRSGFVFRSAVTHDPEGTVRLVGMKDLRPDGGIVWDEVIRLRPQPKFAEYFLREGDILFTVRGARFYGVCVEQLDGEAIASHHLFHIRVRDGKVVEPAFLSWLMNRSEAQQYYAAHARGQSASLGLRRPDMEKLPLHIPPMEKQIALMRAIACLRREVTVLEASVSNRMAIQDALALEICGGEFE